MPFSKLLIVTLLASEEVETGGLAEEVSLAVVVVLGGTYSSSLTSIFCFACLTSPSGTYSVGLRRF